MKSFILSALLISCARVSTIKGPDGEDHKIIECMNIQGCYEKASEICGKYQIVSTTHDNPAIGASSTTMLVKCNVQK